MLTQAIRDRLNQLRGWRAVMPLTFALAFGLGIGLSPVIGLGQGHGIPTPACENNPQLRPICGSDVALVRSIRTVGTLEERVRVAGKGQPGAPIVPNDDEMEVDESITGDHIEVTVRLSKEFLRDLGQPGDQDVEFYTVSVVGKTGTGTCYWDCWYVNGQKKCQCIQM